MILFMKVNENHQQKADGFVVSIQRVSDQIVLGILVQTAWLMPNPKPSDQSPRTATERLDSSSLNVFLVTVAGEMCRKFSDGVQKMSLVSTIEARPLIFSGVKSIPVLMS